MTREEFASLAARGTIILDGAVGSNLYQAGMPRGICTEEWILEHPEPIQKLQREYVKAGTNILYAPTFAANRVTLKGFCLADRLEELNRGIVQMTKENLAGTGVLIAGDLTTTGQLLEPRGNMFYEKLLDVYREQIQVLAEAGVDLVVGGTMLNVDETMAAVDAAMEVCDLPIMCTLSLNAYGTAIYGGTAVEAVETLQAMGASAVGLNCSVGPDQLVAVVRSMKEAAQVPIIAKPNAGVPVINEKGEAVYQMTPETFAGHMVELVKAGAGIVGGCCGTSPAYIQALKRALE